MLNPERCQLLLIDAQERLFPAMPEGVRDQARRNWESLLFLADALGVPVLISEQYPQGLGPTLPGLLPEAGAAGTSPVILPKSTFSVMRDGALARQIADRISDGRRHVLIAGMETHICVALTALDLLPGAAGGAEGAGSGAGCAVSLIADGCLSRRKADWRRGLELCRGAGAQILSAETVLFGMLGRAGGPLFKEISRRIR